MLMNMHSQNRNLCFFLLGVEVLGVTKFVAKIGEDNKPSISLFSQLGFTEVGRCMQVKV